MLDPNVRRLVDHLWDSVWSSGVTNPLAVVEYLTGLFLLRRIESERARASLVADLDQAVQAADGVEASALMARVVAHFGLEPSDPTLWENPYVLGSAIRDVRAMQISDRNQDILGDCFEWILRRLTTAGHFGQFRTPRHVVQFVVDEVRPARGETVLDPACGTGGFLIAAREKRGVDGGAYLGDECDRTMARIAHANLVVHGIDDGRIRVRDGLSSLDQEADVVLANPPFAGAVDPRRASAFRSGARRSELLFLELILHRLRRGGRAGIVVPTGVLTSRARPAIAVRRILVKENRLRGIIELPSGVFRPYTDVRTALIFVSRDVPSREPILMARVNSDGYSLDDRREPVDNDELSTLRGFSERGPDFAFPANIARWIEPSKLDDNEFQLSPGRYLESVSQQRATTPSRPAADLSADAQASTVRLADLISRISGLMQ